nr:translation initiation factor IF-2-like [Equus asinus]
MRLAPAHAWCSHSAPRPLLSAWRGTLGNLRGSTPGRACAVAFWALPNLRLLRPNRSATSTIHPSSAALSPIKAACPLVRHERKQVPARAAVVARPPPPPRARRAWPSAARAAAEVVSRAAPAPSAARARARPAHGAPGLAAAGAAAAAASER